jgi:hypothetical protein
MKKKITWLLLLSVSITSLLSCKKRPVANIEILGRLVDTTATTTTPLMLRVELWTGAPPAESGSTFFGSTYSAVDGTFNMYSKAGWNSDNYYLRFIGHNIVSDMRCYVPDNKTLDIGEIKF